MIGIDIILTSRLEDKVGNSRFYNKILNLVEKNYILTKKRANKEVELKSLAGFFAAKEAILKAFGVGITNGYGFLDITIDHDKFGAPVVILSEKLNKLLKLKGKTGIAVSISHDGEYATAIAFLQ